MPGKRKRSQDSLWRRAKKNKEKRQQKWLDTFEQRQLKFSAWLKNYIEENKIEGEFREVLEHLHWRYCLLDNRMLAKDKRAVPVLIKALGHPHDGARESAIEALGHWAEKGDKRVVMPLIGAFRDLPSEGYLENTRSKIARMLAKSKDNRILPAFLKYLKDRGPAMRRDAAYALGLFKDKRAAEPLEMALQDPHPSIRLAAANALGELAFEMVESKADKARLRLAKKTFAGLPEQFASLLLYFLATHPRELNRVPSNPRAKSGERQYLLNLARGAKERGSFSADFDGLIEILGFGKKKGKK